MYTSKDIQYKTIFVLNCIEERTLRVRSGELLLEESDSKKILTKIPFQKVLMLFVIGHISITTAFIDKCKKFNVGLVVVKPSLRPVFYWADSAEANYLLRQKQYEYENNDISIAKMIIFNKISNQKATRKKDPITRIALSSFKELLTQIEDCKDYQTLMGIEGRASKSFFSAYYQDMCWRGRYPRTKIDPINVVLDIGYTILFNFIECFARMYGFDLYKGVFHRQWFKRKSLICDLIEPFRCLIDKTVRSAFKRNQFVSGDFYLQKGEFVLKRENASIYYKTFVEALIPHKMEIFRYIQAYYRAFMRQTDTYKYPLFLLKKNDCN